MEKFRSFFIKTLITVSCTGSVLIHKKAKENTMSKDLLLTTVLAVIFDPSVMLYFYYKKLEYKKRFLRRMYDPGHRTLALITVFEVLCLVPFYVLSRYWAIFVMNMLSVIAFSVLTLFGGSSRRTIQLERNEEFFKIGFLKTEHFENGELCLNKGEVVQILDRNGGNTVVRKSNGQVFEITAASIDDGIDIVL